MSKYQHIADAIARSTGIPCHAYSPMQSPITSRRSAHAEKSVKRIGGACIGHDENGPILLIEREDGLLIVNPPDLSHINKPWGSLADPERLENMHRKQLKGVKDNE